MSTVRPVACERALIWAALLPDGELSRFERRLLEVHLARCPDCARHADQFAAIVEVVRDTPRESPFAPVRVVRRPRFGRHGLGRLALGGSAAAAAVAALAFTLTTTVGRSPSGSQPTAPLIVVGSSQGTDDEARLWRETQAARRAKETRLRSNRVPGFYLG
jgi:anti-sigma factor RsiW